MKVATATPIDFDALRNIDSVHDAGFKAQHLARRRAHYAALFQRYQDAVAINDEEYEVSITIRSVSKSLTLTAAESDAAFDITAIYEKLGKKLDALKDEIIDLLTDESIEDKKGCFAGTDDPLMHQAHNLCMPQQSADESSAQPAPTRRAA